MAVKDTLSDGKKAASYKDAAFIISTPADRAQAEGTLGGAGLSLATPNDYFDLLKPRVMSLVVFTALAGMLCAPVLPNPLIGLAAILCIAIGAGASGALNMWYDRDIDAQMSRTKKRPLPAGRLAPESALVFGLLLSGFSVFGLAIAANYYAAGLLAFTIFFYAIIYTVWLKRSTPQNIVIGGAAGAFPPMIGYAAAAGGSLATPLSMDMLFSAFTVESLCLFLIIFLWTPPHFWALALYKQGDYGKAGVPMLPNVKGAAHTRTQILIYSVLLAASCVLAGMTDLGAPLYWVTAIILNAVFILLAVRVWRSSAGEQGETSKADLYSVRAGDKAARNLFAYSLIYLFAIFAIIAACAVLKG